MTLELRPYQVDFVAAIRDEFRRSRSVLAVSPTGSGKTVMFSFVTSSAIARGRSVIVAAHRDSICQQISESLSRFGVHHGVIQAGRGMLPARCHVAMIQTLARRADKIPAPDLLVVDEAHHSASDTYARLLDRWSETKVLGVTATPERLDGRGLGRWYQSMAVGPSVAGLIEDGYMAKFRLLAPPSPADMAAVRTSMGDFNVSDLEQVVTKAAVVGDVIDHYRRHMNGKPAIAFCVTRKHADLISDAFREAGYRSDPVDGAMTREVIRDRIAAIGDGRLHVLTACELISEGVDVPVVSGALLLRPTKSLAMYLQQVGRVLRLKPDGSGAVILDHVGNVRRHGMPDAPREWSLDDRAKGKPAAIRTCEVCYRAFSPETPPDCDGVLIQQAPHGAASDPGTEWSPDGCLWWPKPPLMGEAAKGLPENVEGQLVEVSVTPEWAGGLDVIKSPLRDLLRHAKTRERLEEIATVRGYKPGWVRHIMASRGRADA
jgi:DNA repair protein RadD